MINRKDIDDKLWNGCVHFALGAVPYAYTWYLDNICEDWMGIVSDDYQRVMPVIPHEIWGFPGMRTPLFARQLGIFSDVPLSGDVVRLFFDKIPEEYRFVEMPLNESNEVPQNYHSDKRLNYLLPLESNYSVIKTGYADDLKRTLENISEKGLILQTQIKPETFVDFYMNHASGRIKGFTFKHKYSMLRIIYKAMSYSIGSIMGVFDGNKLQAASFMIHHPQRQINVFPVFESSHNGIEAFAFLMDNAVKGNSGQRKYLDFGMPSPLINPQLAINFGAEEVPFFAISKNELPGYMQWIDKWSSGI